MYHICSKCHTNKVIVKGGLCVECRAVCPQCGRGKGRENPLCYKCSGSKYGGKRIPRAKLAKPSGAAAIDAVIKARSPGTRILRWNRALWLDFINEIKIPAAAADEFALQHSSGMFIGQSYPLRSDYESE